MKEGRGYDSSGRKRPARYEPDPFKLEQAIRRAGGTAFAIDWTITTFKRGVTTEALLHPLSSVEIVHMDFMEGFVPRYAYEGFLSKIGKRYACGLCKRTRWKNRELAQKLAPRHLRSVHFGLVDVCDAW